MTTNGNTKFNTDGKPGDIVLDVRDLRMHLYTRWGITKAVDGVSFQLREGETLGIVGESGSGKTMMALSLLQLVPKPAGRIIGGQVLLDGDDLLKKTNSEMSRVRGSKISMILQDPQTSLNPVFTVGNQIRETLGMQFKGEGTRPLRKRAVDALDRTQVADPPRVLSSYPHQLSGGMKQRIVGAIAFSSQPRVLIADEPTTALDVTVQAQYLRLLKDIQRDTGAAILFITHDFGIVANMCDRTAVMYAGRIVEQGTVRDLFNSPSHPYTQALLASVPNVAELTSRLASIEGQPPALFDLPEGCRFAPRCAYADDRCHSDYPPEFHGPEGHTANCWRLEDTWWKTA